jgi:hypothetical protein
MGDGNTSSPWVSFAMLWGPAVPMFGVFCFYLHRMIFKVIPRGLGRINKTIEKEGDLANQNHKEAMELLRGLQKQFEELKPCRRARQRKRAD